MTRMLLNHDGAWCGALVRRPPGRTGVWSSWPVSRAQDRRGPEAVIEVLGIDHIVLRTGRLAAMLEFYTGVLGCRVERQNSPELGLTQLRAGDALIDLVTLEGSLGRAGGGPPTVSRPVTSQTVTVHRVSEGRCTSGTRRAIPWNFGPNRERRHPGQRSPMWLPPAIPAGCRVPSASRILPSTWIPWGWAGRPHAGDVAAPIQQRHRMVGEFPGRRSRGGNGRRCPAVPPPGAP